MEESLKHFADAQKSIDKSAMTFSPLKDVINVKDASEERRNYLTGVSYKAISSGKVAAVIMSGGQGTRLGYPGPKGMYPLRMPSDKTIFQLHIEKILRIRLLAGTESCAEGSNHSVALPSIPVYIMTSDLNHQIIMDFFTENNFFGYPREDILFFEQGLEPGFTFDGKIILESDKSISLSPDGNGGIYRAMLTSGCIEDMQRRGVEHLHIYGIDNVLTKSLDPLFLGACIESKAECGNKVVWRAHKSEKVGVTGECDGRMYILEYSEIPPHLAECEDQDGKLLFGAANICNHYLSVSFLMTEVLPKLSGTYHIAKKKIPFWQDGQTVSPAEPNGIKIEMFIFDVFPLANRWVVYEGERCEEFAPVKNAPGAASDSPDTARAMLSEQAMRWLSAAGATVVVVGGGGGDREGEGKVEDGGNALCEISPLLSYGGENLERFKGTTLRLPCYLT